MAGVLVIENDQPLLRLLTWALMDAGFSVSMSRTAGDAIARSTEIDPSAIVLNLTFPPAEKQTAIKDLKATYPYACLIDMLTPLDQDAPVSGVDARIAPPYVVAEVVKHIASWRLDS